MGFLKGIPACLSPELVLELAKIGHGDEIVLADGHFPAHSLGKAGGATVLRADGLGVPQLLNAILSLIDLDMYVESPVFLMAPTGPDVGTTIPIWATYKTIINEHVKHPVTMALVERFEFYEQAKKASVIVQTGETAKYGNIILKNGLVSPEPESRFWET